MKRSDINPMPEYFDRYINQADDLELSDALQISLVELNALPLERWQIFAHQPLAEGKWSINETIQHLIDTERIFSYRALAFARGDKTPLPSYDEQAYAAASHAHQRRLSELMDELKTLRQSSIHLFHSFSDDVLQRSGQGFRGEYSVLAIGFILAGHQRHHCKLIEGYLSRKAGA